MTKQQLENIISQIAGIEIEITFITETRFSFFYEGQNDKAEQAIINYFDGHGTFEDEAVFDAECDCSCLYFNAEMAA